MQSEHKLSGSNLDDNEPFQIVHNARKNSRVLRSTAMKSRKNSTISLLDESKKKIKKRQRKLTQYLNSTEKWPHEQQQYSEREPQKHSDFLQDPFMQFGSQKMCTQQKIKLEKEQIVLQQKVGQEFSFQDQDVEKGIFEGIGDENSLGRQFCFDFFNPENYRK